jgi:hypothetical protein
MRPDSPLETRRIIERLAPIIRAEVSPIEQTRHVQLVARHLGVPEQPIWDVVRARPRRRPSGPVSWRPASHPRGPYEDRLLALLLRFPDLRSRMRDMPLDLFSDGVNREVFRHLVTTPGEVSPDENGPIRERLEEFARVRLPELTPASAHRMALDYMGAILRARRLERQEATTHDLAELEQQLGTSRLVEVTIQAWNGEQPADDTEAAVQTVIENLELGLSLHRRETPRLA